MRKENKYYCDICKRRLNKRKDHIRILDPYEQDVNDKIVKRDFCKDCLQGRRDDI